MRLIIVNILCVVGLSVLTGCNSTNVVEVPVPVPCVKEENRPEKPAFISLTTMSKMNDYLMLKSMANDLVQYKLYTEQLEIIIDGCSQ